MSFVRIKSIGREYRHSLPKTESRTSPSSKRIPGTSINTISRKNGLADPVSNFVRLTRPWQSYAVVAKQLWSVQDTTCEANKAPEKDNENIQVEPLLFLPDHKLDSILREMFLFNLLLWQTGK